MTPVTDTPRSAAISRRPPLSVSSWTLNAAGSRGARSHSCESIWRCSRCSRALDFLATFFA